MMETRLHFNTLHITKLPSAERRAFVCQRQTQRVTVARSTDRLLVPFRSGPIRCSSIARSRAVQQKMWINMCNSPTVAQATVQKRRTPQRRGAGALVVPEMGMGAAARLHGGALVVRDARRRQVHADAVAAGEPEADGVLVHRRRRGHLHARGNRHGLACTAAASRARCAVACAAALPAACRVLTRQFGARLKA